MYYSVSLRVHILLRYTVIIHVGKMKYCSILDDLCSALIGLVHSPLVQNFMANLVITLVSSISLPLFSANNIYDGIFH